MAMFLYRFRYFGAFVTLLAVALAGLQTAKLTSGDFATIATSAFAVLCGAGAATRFAKPKGSVDASKVAKPEPGE